ncbi:MAG TPA: hypothetical protein VGK73_38990, partial [Polyangiaceae bacterium]
DVWSVGATLFEMLTGSAAHRASSPVAVLARVLTEPAPRLASVLPDVHPALDDFVDRSLRIQRAERYASADEMLARLQQVRAALGLADTPPPTFAPRRPSLPRDDELAELDRRGARTSDGTAVSTSGSKAPAKGRKLPLAVGVVALLSLAAGVLAPLLLGGPRLRPVATAGASGVGRPPPAGPEVAVPSVRAPLPNASPVPSAKPEVSNTKPEAANAKPEVSNTKPRTSRPTCAPTEVLSSGHCCPLGLVWQNARCERPLATSF